MVENTLLTWLPKAIRTEMATTEMKARIKAYSTRVWPFLLFIRRSAILALVITLLIIVFSPPLNKKMFKNFKCCAYRMHRQAIHDHFACQYKNGGTSDLF